MSGLVRKDEDYRFAKIRLQFRRFRIVKDYISIAAGRKN
jgi:hypothetical protein